MSHRAPSVGVARPLSARQRDVLRVIVRFKRATGVAPSLRYIANRLGLHFMTVQEYIEALYAKGWLETPTTSGNRCLHEPSEGEQG
jgi:Mn-dependent DtxR family transcriptional regulator